MRPRTADLWVPRKLDSFERSCPLAGIKLMFIIRELRVLHEIAKEDSRKGIWSKLRDGGLQQDCAVCAPNKGRLECSDLSNATYLAYTLTTRSTVRFGLQCDMTTHQCVQMFSYVPKKSN